jgi:peptide/nickel transport system ATP-binding protein
MSGPRHELSGIPGSPPDLSDLPLGCRFAPRCPYVMDRCRQENPPLASIKGSHRQVACWLQTGDPGVVVPVELSREVRVASDVRGDRS